MELTFEAMVNLGNLSRTERGEEKKIERRSNKWSKRVQKRNAKHGSSREVIRGGGKRGSECRREENGEPLL